MGQSESWSHWQTPLTQALPLAQVNPHWLQDWALNLRSTHAASEGQKVSPAEQGGGVQRPVALQE